MLLFGIGYQGLKLAKENPLILALTASFISYCIQAMVNVNQPVTTPLFIVILSILGNLVRKEKNTLKTGEMLKRKEKEREMLKKEERW